MTSQPQPHNPFDLVPVKKNGRSRKNDERDTTMFEAVLRGETLAAAGKLGGVTKTRVEQIIKKRCRMMLHPVRLRGDVIPDNTSRYTDRKLAEIRRHADFWLAQLAKWKVERRT